MHWMHQDTTMYQVQEKIHKLNSVGEESWIFELRIRYLPNDLSDLYEKDKTTFSCYYDQVILSSLPYPKLDRIVGNSLILFQVRNDYLAKKFESLNLDTAIQLCCLEIRRFFSDLPQIALDKKSNFEYLEREVGLARFLPHCVIVSNKPKAIRKMIQQHFKKYANYQERECMFKFFEILKTIYKFDQERFRCALGVS